VGRATETSDMSALLPNLSFKPSNDESKHPIFRKAHPTYDPTETDGLAQAEVAKKTPHRNAYRQTILYVLHSICFVVHLSFAVLTYITAKDNDMSIEVLRVKPVWVSRGNYNHEVVPSKYQIIYIDVLTIIFFGLSAIMHGMWLACGLVGCGPNLFKQLDNCLCWW
jgi:hypothetical protein